MSSMKKIFENETKTRINLIGPPKSGKSTLIFNLARHGIFTNHHKIENNIFPTEVLYSSPRNNYIKVFLDFEKKEEILAEVKRVLLNIIDEAFMEELKESSIKNRKNKFYNKFEMIIKEKIEIPLIRMFENVQISDIFKDIDFSRLFSDLSKVSRNDNLEEKDEFIWRVYFSSFEYNLSKMYDKWIEKLSKCYINDDEGCRYENQNDGEKFLSNDFNELLDMIYDNRNSCGLIIKRVYMELPADKNEYMRTIFIDYNNKNINSNIASDIVERVSEDYKELFILVGNCSNNASDLYVIKDAVNKVTLDKRIFCILNKFDLYVNKNSNDNCESISEIRHRISKNLGIKENRIIITEKFMDVDRKTFEVLPSNKDFMRLFNTIKLQSQHLVNPIKIRRTSSKNNIINISLNQERMSVQALVNMLYDRYNGYLVDLWGDIIKHEKEDDRSKKYYYNCVSNVIKNRKDDYTGFRCEKKGFINYNKAIDFSITNGDYNDSKKIVKMLVNYGYHTVGFNSHENKILVTVNGEISKEDRENLIELIKGRLEESAVKYFENAFLMDVSRKKFNVNSLKSSLEFEKSITVDDFYNAFKKAFKKMSENIERYEVSLIE